MKDNNEYYNAKIQKILNKLISEEWLAGNMYSFYMQTVDSEERSLVFDMFGTLSDDEIDDHYKSLVDWALLYGYDVPCTIRDIERYASKNAVRLFNSFTKNKDAMYYVKKSIEAEKDAIMSYQEALQSEELVQFGDLKAIILRNYTDELEHLENLGIYEYSDSITIQV